MIAIMPNTISREILSAGGRATARVANRAKNNNEMSDGEQDRTAERMAENRAGRAKRRLRVKEESKATGNGDRECHGRRGKEREKNVCVKKSRVRKCTGGERDGGGIPRARKRKEKTRRGEEEKERERAVESVRNV